MKRISKKVRDEAIDACLLLAEASLLSEPSRFWGFLHKPVSELFDYGEVGADLVLSAWTEVFDSMVGVREADRYAPDTYLEAAALLRDGWSPGEPVERLAKGETNAR